MGMGTSTLDGITQAKAEVNFTFLRLQFLLFFIFFSWLFFSIQTYDLSSLMEGRRFRRVGR
jgi:hypothetical protein